MGAQRMLRASVAFVGREFSVWIDFTLKAIQKCLPGWLGSGASVSCAAPRDLDGYLPVDVLHG
jgi:hypothetical protein